MSASKLISGTVIELGGLKYVVPPFNFDLLERYSAVIFNEESASQGEKVKMSFQLCIDSIARNYPDIDVNYLKKELDIVNVAAIIAAVSQTSGLVSSVDEVEKKQEAQA